MMKASCKILSLRDCPEFADTCAAWSFGEWGCQTPRRSFTQIQKEYQQRAASYVLPQTWIAIIKDKPAGIVSLKLEDCPTRPDLSPWLASLFVHSFYRQQGIARLLMAHCETEAKQTYNFERLYLFTPIDSFYTALGWQKIGVVDDPLGLHTAGEALMMKKL